MRRRQTCSPKELVADELMNPRTILFAVVQRPRVDTSEHFPLVIFIDLDLERWTILIK